MLNEIGSEFWHVPSSEPNDFFSRCEGDIAFTMSGRTSILYILQEVESTVTTKIVYMPAYCCDSMVAPFRLKGYDIHFYDITHSFEPVIQLNLLKSAGVFFTCDYFGFPTSIPQKFIDTCRKHHIITIHDITMSLFSQVNYTNHDYLLGSFRKWIGIASGGLAIALKKPFSTQLLPPLTPYIQTRQKALNLKAEYIQSPSESLKTQVRDLFLNAEALLNGATSRYASDTVSIDCLRHYPYLELIEKRRRNYLTLLEGFSSLANINILHASMSADTCPMFFIIFTDDRDRFKQYLIENQVYPPVHWPIPENREHSENSKQIANAILSIPCDQRYGTQEMERIVALARFFFKTGENTT